MRAVVDSVWCVERVSAAEVIRMFSDTVCQLTSELSHIAKEYLIGQLNISLKSSYEFSFVHHSTFE